MTKIGFIQSSTASFILKDIELLNREFDVNVYQTNIRLSKPRQTIRSILNIFKGVHDNDVSYTWFASHHALIMSLVAKVLHKKSIVVIGGYEVEDRKNIDYGAMNKPITSIIVKTVLKLTTKILTVSNYSHRKTLKYTTENKTSMIWNGIDNIPFHSNTDKDKTVVTIGAATHQTYKLKGLELFAQLSNKIPDAKFIIIGDYDQKTKDYLQKIGANLQFTGLINHKELFNYLENAKVYCQLSAVESFGISLAEAISLNCIPVILDNGAMKELFGEYSIITDKNNIVSDITKALNTSKTINTRDHILNKFSSTKRLNKLIQIIKGVVK